jgi:hypothetical protein
MTRKIGITIAFLAMLLTISFSTARRSLAEEPVPSSEGPPGGNPGLTWFDDPTVTLVNDKLCTLETSGCIDIFSCHSQDVSYGGNLYKSWKSDATVTYGNCVSTTIPDSTCHHLNSVLCAKVRLYAIDGCNLNQGSVVVDLYAKACCQFVKQK